MTKSDEKIKVRFHSVIYPIKWNNINMKGSNNRKQNTPILHATDRNSAVQKQVDRNGNEAKIGFWMIVYLFIELLEGYNNNKK